MNKEKWNKYVQKEDIINTEHGMEGNDRSNDLTFILNFLNYNNKKVLDIGCEEGLVIDELSRSFGCDVMGVTFGNIDEKKTHYIKQGDMHELPFDDNSFDVVFIMHTLEHSISPYIVLSEIKRVLMDGGELLIIMPEEGDIWTSVPQHYSTMTFRQLFNLLHKLKFTSRYNFRKEYSINLCETKRDIISIWKNTKRKEIGLLEKQSFLVPSLGAPHPIKNYTITPILITIFDEEKMYNNHFIGRTDSLKGG